MALSTGALLTVGFLLLTQGALTSKAPTNLSITLTVENHPSHQSTKSYSTTVVKGGVLLGAMKRLQETSQDFKFTVTENIDFGPYLESVNGVAGNKQNKTYWELLSNSSGEYTPLDVGVGCYQPKENEHIVFNFTTWPKN